MLKVPSTCDPKGLCGQGVYHTYGITFFPLHLIAIKCVCEKLILFSINTYSKIEKNEILHV